MKTMKRWALPAGIALGLLVLAACAGTPREPAAEEPRWEVLPSLRMIWEDYFPMGNIIASVDFGWRDRPSDLLDPARRELLLRHFDILTAEDEMKPDWLRRTAWSWNAGGAERIMDFAEENNRRVHGHVLVWHSQTQPWMYAQGDRSRSAEAIANMEYHIELVMRHFGTRMDSWEVLNEIFPSGVGPGVTADNWRTRLRTSSGWYRAIGTVPNGDCFIWTAFTTARRVADEIDREAGRPLNTMVLYYNDYNEDTPGKRLAIYYMVREMNERFARENNGRRLIDAVGMQAHYHLEGPGTGAAFGWGPILPSNVRATIERWASLGVYVSITELDITIGNTDISPITARQERMQAQMYAQLFQIFRENAQHIRRVSIWGIDDPSSWRHRGSPLLFDGRLQPKEAFWAVANPDAFLADPDAFLADPKAFVDERFWQ